MLTFGFHQKNALITNFKPKMGSPLITIITGINNAELVIQS